MCSITFNPFTRAAETAVNSAHPTIRSCSCDSALTGCSLCRDLLDILEIAVLPGIVLCA